MKLLQKFDTAFFETQCASYSCTTNWLVFQGYGFKGQDHRKHFQKNAFLLHHHLVNAVASEPVNVGGRLSTVCSRLLSSFLRNIEHLRKLPTSECYEYAQLIEQW